MGTNVSLFNWLTTLRGFLSPYPSKIFMSHKGNGETDFLMSGQLFILTHAFTLLTHLINHTFTQSYIYSYLYKLTHSLFQIDDDEDDDIDADDDIDIVDEYD